MAWCDEVLTQTVSATLARPDFSMFVWLRKSDRFVALEAELLNAAGVAPYGVTEYQGLICYHWSAANFNEAKRLIDALTPVAQHRELVLQQIMSRVYGEEVLSIKDERRRSAAVSG